MKLSAWTEVLDLAGHAGTQSDFGRRAIHIDGEGGSATVMSGMRSKQTRQSILAVATFTSIQHQSQIALRLPYLYPCHVCGKSSAS